MSENALWFGFIDAGEKSSPVIIDKRLNTGDPKTIYVFNLKRNQILEYKREIAEPKLRELKGKEQEVVPELEAAFNQARRGFKPRAARVLNVPEKGTPRAAAEQAEETDEEGGDFDDMVGADEPEDVEEDEEDDWAEEEDEG